MGDSSPPSLVVVSDDGAFTNATTQLHAMWTASTDVESGIVGYQYEIRQDSTTGALIVPWTSVGLSTDVTITGLTLTVGATCFIGVQAQNGAGLWSAVGYSDGIMVSQSTNVGGSITANTRWGLAGSPYIVTATVTVSNNTTLTLEPGVEVRFNANTALVLGSGSAGILSAQGTLTHPIRFTSNSALPVPGQWNGINFSLTTSASILDYCLIEYGGADSNNANLRIASSTPTIQNSTIRYSDGYGISVNSASPTLIDLTVSQNGLVGITGEGSGTVILQNSTVRENTSQGLLINGIWNLLGVTISGNGLDGILTNGGSLSIDNAVITNNGGYPINLHPHTSLRSTTGLTAGGNIVEVIAVRGPATLNKDVLWESMGLPYRLLGNLSVWANIGLPAPVLTLSACVTVQVSAGKSLVIGSTGGNLGALIVQGTATNPVMFTSASMTPSAGDWGGILLADGTDDTLTKLDYCVLEYGGGVALKDATGASYYANLVVDRTQPALSNLTLRSSNQDGLVFVSSNAILQGEAILTNNLRYGLYVVSGSSPSLQLNSGMISQNGSIGLLGNEAMVSLQNVTISQNGAEGLRAKGEVALTSVVITGNGQAGLKVTNPGSLNVSFSTISGNGAEGVVLDNPTQADIHHTNFVGNVAGGIHLSNSSVSADATLNWWGDASGPSGIGPGSGDSADSANIAFEPWLGAPFTQPFEITVASAHPTTFNQNGNYTTLSASFQDSANWAITIKDSTGVQVKNFAGTGTSLTQDWFGDDTMGVALGDGIYTYHMDATSTTSSQVAAPIVGRLSLQNNLPIVHITSPTEEEVLSGGGTLIPILGTAKGSSFASYVLEFGQGSFPLTWTQITMSTTAVDDGTLDTWGTSSLTQRTYTVRLIATDTENRKAEDRVTVHFILISNLSTNPNSFSPNDDGDKDTTTITSSLTFSGNWTLVIKDPAGVTVRAVSGSGSAISFVWDGTDDQGVRLGEGTYTIEVNAIEPNSGISAVPKTATIALDTTPPTAVITNPSPGSIVSCTVSVLGSADDPHFLSYTLELGNGASPTSWTLLITSYTPVTNSLLASWNAIPYTEGTYTLRLTVTDGASNTITTTVTFTIDNIQITNVSEAPTTINPAIGQTSTISYTLDDPADITIEIRDPQGNIVARPINNLSRPATSNTDAWNGKDDTEALLPYEAHTYTMTATDSTSGKCGVYNPLPFFGPVTMSNITITPIFDPFQNERSRISYDLNVPARLTLRVGPLPIRELVNNVPRDITGNVEYWDGRDDQGQLVTPESYFIGATYTTQLPRNTIITGDQELNVDPITVWPYVFYPSYGEATKITYPLSRDATVQLKILDPAGANFNTTLLSPNPQFQTAGNYTYVWAGTDDQGHLIATSGEYKIQITLTDAGGNTTISRTAQVFAYK